jgi:transaldolase
LGAACSRPTKNARYRDVRYVEELIGPETVNTITPATLEAFRDHGRLRASLGEDVTGARHVIAALESTGISLREVTDKLLEDGVTLFCEAFDTLLTAVDKSRRSTSVRTAQRDPGVT